MKNPTKEASIKVQEGFVNETKGLIVKENLVETLNTKLIEFNENPEYGTFKAIKETVDSIEKTIKGTLKDLMIENNLKSSEGPAGKFTLVTKKNVAYMDTGEDTDPRVKKAMELEQELKALKEEITNDVLLFKKEISGAIVTDTTYVTFRAAKANAKGKAIVFDYVDGESA